MIEKFLGRENKLSTEFFPELIEKLFFQKTCFPFQRAFCAYCHDRIWGLGRQVTTKQEQSNNKKLQ
jgi:hypothetical protein